NASQSDFDFDGEGDACDTNDGVILFTGLTVSQIMWQNEAGYQRFNLYRSSLERLRTTGEYTQLQSQEPEAAQFCNLHASTMSDSRIPPIGRVNLYLVTGVHAGIESTLGTTSSGATRPNAQPCP